MKKERTTLADRLKASIAEGIDFARGTTELRTTLVPVGRSYTGEEVAGIRAKRQMSQAQFAKLLAVSVKTLQSWEQGVRRPSKSTMRLLQIFDEPEQFQQILMVREPRSRYSIKPEQS
jgi:putative transcriptional regulator